MDTQALVAGQPISWESEFISTSLHLLNARGEFDPIRERVETCFAESMKEFGPLLDIHDVDVVAYAGQNLVIPEFGIGGYAPTGYRVYMVFDLDHPTFTNSDAATPFETIFRRLLAHELHHCARWRSVGYGSTLFEALISEGLACQFETEIADGVVPFYAQALSSEEMSRLFEKAKPELHRDTYNHAEWFFGNAQKGIPRHAGYSIGFDWVKQYLQQNDGRASQLINTSAQHFLAYT